MRDVGQDKERAGRGAEERMKEEEESWTTERRGGEMNEREWCMSWGHIGNGMRDLDLEDSHALRLVDKVVRAFRL